MQEEIKELTDKVVNLKPHIIKAIQNLVGYVFIYPNTKVLFIQIYKNGMVSGYYDEEDNAKIIFTHGCVNLNETRITESFTSKALLNLVDNVGQEHLVEFLQERYMKLLILDFKQ